MLTVSGAARRLGVHVNTVRAWTDQGRLSCLRINERGDRRYRAEEIDRFLARAAPEPATAELATAGGNAPARRPPAAPRDTATAGPRAPQRAVPATSEARSATIGRIADAAAGGDVARVFDAALAALDESGYRAAICLSGPDGIRRLAGELEPDRELAAAAIRRRDVVRGPHLAWRGRRPASRSARAVLIGRDSIAPKALAVPVDERDDGRVVLQAVRHGGARQPPAPALDTRAETALLAAVAAQLRAVMRAEGRARRVEERLRRAELLLAAGGEINSQLDLPRSLRQLAENALELFAADHAAIFRQVPGGGVAAEVSLNLSAAFVSAIEHARSLRLLEQALEKGEVVTAIDYPSDPRAAGKRQALLAEGINTATLAPLISEGERLGVLALYHDRPYAWTADALATLELLAHQGAVAVRNARNYGQMATWAAQLQSIQQLGSRLTRLSSVSEIGQAIAAELHQLIDYHNVRVYRVVGGDCVPVAWRGEVGEYVGEDGDQLRVRVGEGITGWVARHGLAQNLGDAASDRRAMTIPGTDDDLDESLLLAPMLYEDEVIGVIVLAKLGLHQFTSDDLRLLEIYASIAAQAMANADSTERLRAQSEALERQLQSQRELLRVTESILATLDTQALLEEIAERLGSLLHVDNIGVDVYDQAAHVLRPIFARGAHAAAYLGRELPDDEGVAGWVVRTGEPAMVDDELNDPRVAHFEELGPQAGALIVAPLRRRDGIAGLLTIERLGADARFSEEEFELVKLFAGHVSIALANAERHRAVELRAETDALTGLNNQGSLTVHLERAVERGEPFALLMVDLDDFKLFNDRRGHQAGNVMLERLAGVLRAARRESDVVFRYGGDEFAILLPGASVDGGVEVANKVRQAVTSVTDGRRPPIVVTASIGVAAYPADGTDAASVLLAADRACYAAKRAGRDRIATAAEGLALATEFLPPPTPVDEPGPAYPAA